MNYDIKLAIENQKRENKFSHAYLVETNNISKISEEIKTILKILLCEKDKLYCNECQNCHFIDESSHPNIIDIYPDGAHIKVGQIEELRNKFNSKASFGRYNIYVVYNAEKLNPTSANALLKFLEEPEENIIGILITTNKSLILPTINSRCQCYIKIYDESHYPDSIIELAKMIDNLDYSWNDIIKYQDIISSLEDKNDLKQVFAYLLEQEVNKNNNIKKTIILRDIVNKIRYNVNIDLVLLDYLLRMREINE